MDNTEFNDCICELMGDRMQTMVLDFLYDNYRFNRAAINRFDKILEKHNVEKSNKYGESWRIKDMTETDKPFKIGRESITEGTHFEILYNGECVIKVFDNDDVEEFLELLNQLSKENEELTQFRNLAKDYNIPFDKLCDAFEAGLNQDTITDLETENGKLKEENRRLKERYPINNIYKVF